jgi:hypothetical protein
MAGLVGMVLPLSGPVIDTRRNRTSRQQNALDPITLNKAGITKPTPA